MSLMDDRLAAIGRIEEKVYGGLQEGQRPKLLAERLFDLLRTAVAREGFIGAQLSRSTAAKDLGTTPETTSFKNAMERIEEELERCRPDDPGDMPAAEDRRGVACVKAFLADSPYLVFIRGPRGSVRGDPKDSLLRLRVEFREIPAESNLQPPENVLPVAATKPATENGLPKPRASIRLLWAGASVVVLIAAMTGWRAFRRFKMPERPSTPLVIPAETNRYYAAYGGRISPDGNRIAFLACAPSSGRRFIYVRELADDDAVAISDSEGDFTPFFWSYDGMSLYFVTGGFLKRKRIGQEAIEKIVRVDGAPRGAANQNGVVLLSSKTGIQLVHPNGRTVQITTSKNESAHAAPYFLPDGVSFLFLAISHHPSGVLKTLYSGRIDAPNRIRRIAPISSRVEWSADHLLYARGQALYARPWSLERQSFSGPEKLVTRGVWSKASTSDADFSVARNGRLSVKDAPKSRFERVRLDSTSIPIPWQGQVVGIAVARDRELAVVTSNPKPDSDTDLWVWDLKTQPRKLRSVGTITSPVLDADGDEVFYAANRNNFSGIFRRSIVTEAESPVPVPAGDGAPGPRGLSRDGELLLYATSRPQNTDLYCKNLKNGEIIAIAASPKAMEGETGRFSPDKKHVAYVSDVTGDRRVYVAPFPPDGTPARPISPPGGWRARWSNDGKKIYYLLGQNLMEYGGVENARVVYRADSDISHMEPTAHGEFLVVIVPKEPPNRIVADWQDAIVRGR